MDFSETIEVKVFDKNEDSSVDSYFFAYFHDLSGALDQIRDAVRAHRVSPQQGSPKLVLDTTVPRPSTIDRAMSSPPETAVKSTSGFRLTSFLRPFQESITVSRPSVNVLNESPSEVDDFTYITRRDNSASFIPVTTPLKPIDGLPSFPEAQEGSRMSLTPTPSTYEHTYPPSTSISSLDSDHPSLSRESNSWGVGVPSWLRAPRRVFGGSLTSEPAPVTNTRSEPAGIKEMYGSSIRVPLPQSRSSGLGDMAFSVLDTPEIAVDPETTEKFRTVFAYDEKETLLGCAPFLNYALALGVSEHTFF